VDLEAGFPVDDVLQHPGRLGLVLVGVGSRVLPGAELLQRGFFVAGIHQQQQLPDQLFGAGVLVDPGFGVDAVGEVVVRIEFGVGQVHVWTSGGGGAQHKRSAVCAAFAGGMAARRDPQPPPAGPARRRCRLRPRPRRLCA